jgi:sugar-specific transcriptional regulator TrmB
MTINNQNKNKGFIESAMDLGLSSKAAMVYVRLLEAKKAIAPIVLINITKIHRQYVFDALRELQQKELVETIGHGRGVKYLAHTPQLAIKHFEEQRLNALEGAKHLMSLFKKTPHGVIEIIEGGEMVVAGELALMNNQKKGDWLDIVGGAGTSFVELFGNRFTEYEQARKRVKCKIRYIGTASDIQFNKETTIKDRFDYEIRYLDNIDNIINICVRPDSVSFNMYAPEPIAIRIKNPETVASQKALFDILWKVAKIAP